VSEVLIEQGDCVRCRYPVTRRDGGRWTDKFGRDRCRASWSDGQCDVREPARVCEDLRVCESNCATWPCSRRFDPDHLSDHETIVAAWGAEQALKPLREIVPQDYEADDEHTVDAAVLRAVHALLYPEDQTHAVSAAPAPPDPPRIAQVIIYGRNATGPVMLDDQVFPVGTRISMTYPDAPVEVWSWTVET
jgi:hypothetical protein